MIIKAYNEKHSYLLFVDLEFNNGVLIQFAGLLFQRIDEETYQLARSYNAYVTDTVSYPFMEYTSITNTFLTENGVPLKDLIIFLEDSFLKDIDLNNTLLISHGLRNDRLVLENNGIFLLKDNGTAVDGYCTFNNAKRILKRNNKLTLADIAEECGYYLHQAHNAYNDVWAEVSVFTYLRKIEEQNKGEE